LITNPIQIGLDLLAELARIVDVHRDQFMRVAIFGCNDRWRCVPYLEITGCGAVWSEAVHPSNGEPLSLWQPARLDQ